MRESHPPDSNTPAKVVGAPGELGPAGQAAAPPAPVARPVRADDDLTNPRDGRGPLRPRDDQAAKLPLRPPH